MVSPAQTVSIQSGCTAVLMTSRSSCVSSAAATTRMMPASSIRLATSARRRMCSSRFSWLPLDVGVDAVEHAADAEEVDHLAVLEQLALERLGDALPVGLLLAGHQDQRGLLVVLLGPMLGLDDARLPLVVAQQHPVADGGLAVGQRLADDAAAPDLVVVDDHEAAGGRDVRRQVAGDGAVELEDALGHVVPLARHSAARWRRASTRP